MNAHQLLIRARKRLSSRRHWTTDLFMRSLSSWMGGGLAYCIRGAILVPDEAEAVGLWTPLVRPADMRKGTPEHEALMAFSRAAFHGEEKDPNFVAIWNNEQASYKDVVRALDAAIEATAPKVPPKQKVRRLPPSGRPIERKERIPVAG